MVRLPQCIMGEMLKICEPQGAVKKEKASPTRSQECHPHSSSVAGIPAAHRRVVYSGKWKQSTARLWSPSKLLIHGSLPGEVCAKRASMAALAEPAPHRQRNGWGRRRAESWAARTACTTHTSRHTRSRGEKRLIFCIWAAGPARRGGVMHYFHFHLHS